MRADRQELTIRLEPGAGWIEVQWLVEGANLSTRYSIQAATVEAAGAAVRAALSELERIVPRTSGQDEARAVALRGVAAAGQQLYRALFIGSSPDQNEAAARQRSWFETEVLSEPEKWRVQFVQTAKGRIMPWGLTFTEREGRDLSALGAAMEDYQDFWCIGLSCAIRGVIQPPKRTTLVNNIRIGAILEADNNTLEHYCTRANNLSRQDMESLKQNLIGDKRRAREVKRQAHETACYYYISLKAEADNDRGGVDDGGSYTYGGERIRPRDILPDSGGHIRLVLFDGDAVIRYDRGEEWVEFCMNEPLSGCIAVESDIAQPENHMFGWSIFEHAVQSDKPLLDSVAEAREKYWPMSILYGLYCNPLNVSVNCTTRDIGPIADFIRFQKTQKIETRHDD